MIKLSGLGLGPGSGRVLLLGLLVVLGGWLARADPLAPFGRVSWMAYDTAQQWLRPAKSVDRRIVIVDIDDPSLQAIGRWPWPRERLAELIDATQAAEPAMLGLDILFPEATERQADLALARRLAQDNVVTATAFGGIQLGEASSRPISGQELKPHRRLHHQGRVPALGHITPQLEEDGRIRRLYPVICSPESAGEDCRPTLALAMLERWVGIPAERLPARGGSRLCVASFCQWLDDRHGGLLIPYHHPSRFDYLSAADVLDGQHQQHLAGSLVLLGTSAAGLGDLVATPRGALTPGVELHAVLLAAWLDGQAWRPLPQTGLWQIAGLLALAGAMAPGLGSQRTRLWQWGLASGVAAVLLVTPPLLAIFGWWFDPWAWWGGVLATAMLWLGWERWQLWHRHRRLYRAFGAYVPRSVLLQLAEKGGEQRFAPQRRPLVVMFSDIRGFTALSERLPPERLTALTNRIFTELTEVVHEHGGTLDKYIGDALMAFWGAPLASGHEAQQALDCALTMQRRLESINRWCSENGYPDIAMNIGMEAGEVTVGNLGSRQRRTYTALGHAVNLAARLEVQASQRGEPIVIGPELAETLKKSGLLSPLGHCQLKGVSKPVAIWKPAQPIAASPPRSAGC